MVDPWQYYSYADWVRSSILSSIIVYFEVDYEEIFCVTDRQVSLAENNALRRIY